jgi:NADP-dependent 3-hydroxy acid dehydrogenase YdfG
MSKAIMVVGYGPGISNAVAERFGKAGFSVALVGRNAGKLGAGVNALKANGIKAAAAFTADAGSPDGMRRAVEQIRASLGPVAVIHWNAIGGDGVRDILTADAPALDGMFDVAIFGLLAAVQAALPDLKSSGDGAVLVTNGAFGDDNEFMDKLAINLKSTGVALSNAAKRKLVGLLAQGLKDDNVYVGEVTVAGTIKGTPWGNESSIDPADVAAKFWALYEGRSETRDRIAGLI